MHVFVNMFMVRHVLKIDREAIAIFRDRHDKTSEFERHMWSLFATKRLDIRDVDPPLQLDELIVLPSSGVSRLNYYNNPSRLSRLVVDFSEFVTKNTLRGKSNDVLISRRAPYMRDGSLYHPGRALRNWKEVTDELEEKELQVRPVDFSASRTRDILSLVRSADALVGVHGAGLVWSVFMRRGSKLFEVFGGNRGRENTHYKKIATYVDLEYDCTTVPRLHCGEECRSKMARFIKGPG